MAGTDASGSAGPSQPVPIYVPTGVVPDAPTDAPIDEPHLEGPVCRVITYQESPSGPMQRWSPARKIRRCDCWKTYSYPDRVVLAVDDERRCDDPTSPKGEPKGIGEPPA